MRQAYNVLLRLYPEGFRRRYGAEMALDFADGWIEARAAGATGALRFAARAAGDLVMSLLREWTHGAGVAIVAGTAGTTLLLWGLALRPWAWNWNIQPGPPRHAHHAPSVTGVDLFALAAAAMIPIVVVLLLAPRMVKRR